MTLEYLGALGSTYHFRCVNTHAMYGLVEQEVEEGVDLPVDELVIGGHYHVE